MKNMWKSLSVALVVLGAAGTTMMTSCDKQKSMSELNATVQQAEAKATKQTANQNKNSARERAESVSVEDYQKMIKGVASTMDQSEDYTLKVELDEDGNYTVTPHAGRLAPPQGTLICQDTHVSLGLAYCASSWQTTHPHCRESWYFDNTHHTVSVYGICPG